MMEVVPPASSREEPQHQHLHFEMLPSSSYYSNNNINSNSNSNSNGGVGQSEEEEGRGWARTRAVEREHLFDKVVTPSDVGKLNRLVIPKQHAEKHFPLDSSNNDKGLLLNFEDPSGKSWRFRYSYWNSSQSYVMTKGWSRFVKDKNLHAGDIVSFLRGSHSHSLFIDCRRSPKPPLPVDHFSFRRSSSAVPWTPLVLPHYPQYANNTYGYGWNYNPNPQIMSSSTFGSGSGSGINYQQLQLQQAPDPDPDEAMALKSVPVHAAGKNKLRLFGVNMETESSDESSDHDCLGSTASQVSSSSHLQLRLYSGTPLHHLSSNNNNKGKPSSNSMSLDFHM